MCRPLLLVAFREVNPPRGILQLQMFTHIDRDRDTVAAKMSGFPGKFSRYRRTAVRAMAIFG